MRILLLEDEIKLASHIKKGMEEEGYAVDHAPDGEEALWLGESYTYDAMVFDVMTPGLDGFTVVRRLRRKEIQTPVIFLTARGDVEDKIRGLDAGGDDYLVKPFSMLELLARLRALLRRQRPQMNNVIRVADLELDLVLRQAKRGEEVIELTNKEFALLEFLMSQSPRPVRRTIIMEHVWDQHFDSGGNVVNVYVKRLREKIDQPGRVPLLRTVRGLGFAIGAE